EIMDTDQRWKAQMDVFDHLAKQRQDLMARFELEQTIYQEANGKHEELQKRVIETEAAWRAKYEPWSLDSIQEIYAQFEQKETLADQLRARIDQSIPFIEETKKGLDTLKLSKVDLEKRLVQLQTSYQGQTELWKEKQARLTM